MCNNTVTENKAVRTLFSILYNIMEGNTMSTNDLQKHNYKHVSTKEKYCFGIGAIGKDAIVNLVGSFLMLYLTDTLYLSPSVSCFS